MCLDVVEFICLICVSGLIDVLGVIGVMCRGRAGWQAMVRREGRHSSSQTADSCSTETPTFCRGWPELANS